MHCCQEPLEITKHLEDEYKFELKGMGPIEFHLGCNFSRDKDNTLFMHPDKFIERMVNSYQQMFGEKLKKTYQLPLKPGDHPKIDTTDFCNIKDITVFQSLIGSCQWAMSLCRLDITSAVMTLSSFRAKPWVGHLMHAK